MYGQNNIGTCYNPSIFSQHLKSLVFAVLCIIVFNADALFILYPNGQKSFGCLGLG